MSVFGGDWSRQRKGVCNALRWEAPTVYSRKKETRRDLPPQRSEPG